MPQWVYDQDSIFIFSKNLNFVLDTVKVQKFNEYLIECFLISFQVGLFNFRPSVRPVPLEVHISGFPGKHYCPRMATMNKPTFQGISI